jgi:hypothetical protein
MSRNRAHLPTESVSVGEARAGRAYDASGYCRDPAGGSHDIGGHRSGVGSAWRADPCRPGPLGCQAGLAVAGRLERTVAPLAHSPRIDHKVTGAEALGFRKPLASVSPETRPANG